MARIKDTSVEAVKRAANIVDVVSARTSLRKAGGRLVGRCPFHEERTPSFSIDPAENLYYCFGCNRGGDVVKFVRETENLDFVEAIEHLAERFNVQLEYEETSPGAERARTRRDRLHKLLEQATTYFERMLWETEAGGSVRAYLDGRGFREPIVREFRLGLSPGNGLVAKARERGFTADEIRAAGLSNARGNDYFPFRLMFPLADARGRTVGFQARIMRDDDPLPRAKYVNTPEGELFKKGNLLYGLHLARPAIAKQERAVVVEGNADVIALRQAGFEPVVASMGTALTQAQLDELWRLTRRLYLCFDSDAAGQEATLRGMELAVAKGFDVQIVTLREGKDPADAPDGFAEQLGRAENYLHYRVRITLDRAVDRNQAYLQAREILERAEDSPPRQEALRLVADRLELPPETLAAIPAARGGAAAPQPVQAPPRLLEAGLRLERETLAAAVAHEKVRRALEALSSDHFDDPLHRRMQRALVTGGGEDDELVALRAELRARAERDEIGERMGEQLVFRLRERRVKRDLQGADLARVTELQAQLVKVRQRLAELQ
ncbi:MAG: DNA primase [Gaiellales bacterium]